MHNLQTIVESNTASKNMDILTNLRNCVQSAATVVTSASTALGLEPVDHHWEHGSEFGDCFPSQPSETMMRWMDSNTVYEVDEDDRGAPVTAQGRNALIDGRADDANSGVNSDSDSDLEVELVKAMYKRGKEKLTAEDFSSAERLFRNCLSRTSTSGDTKASNRALKPKIMTHLLETYRKQEKWDDARALLIDKMAQGSRTATSDNPGILYDMLDLVEVLIQKGDYMEARLYGRKGLKGYRKLGPTGLPGVETSLRLLILICTKDGDLDEGDAYGSILADLLDQKTTTEKPPELEKAALSNSSSSPLLDTDPVTSKVESMAVSAATTATTANNASTAPAASFGTVPDTQGSYEQTVRDIRRLRSQRRDKGGDGDQLTHGVKALTLDDIPRIVALEQAKEQRPKASSSGKHALILFDYKRAEDNELELREGEQVYDIDFVHEDWWMGQSASGETGLFPSKYVKVVDDHMTPIEATISLPPTPALPKGSSLKPANESNLTSRNSAPNLSDAVKPSILTRRLFRPKPPVPEVSKETIPRFSFELDESKENNIFRDVLSFEEPLPHQEPSRGESNGANTVPEAHSHPSAVDLPKSKSLTKKHDTLAVPSKYKGPVQRKLVIVGDGLVGKTSLLR